MTAFIIISRIYLVGVRTDDSLLQDTIGQIIDITAYATGKNL